MIASRDCWDGIYRMRGWRWLKYAIGMATMIAGFGAVMLITFTDPADGNDKRGLVGGFVMIGFGAIFFLDPIMDRLNPILDRLMGTGLPKRNLIIEGVVMLIFFFVMAVSGGHTGLAWVSGFGIVCGIAVLSSSVYRN